MKSVLFKDFTLKIDKTKTVYDNLEIIHNHSFFFKSINPSYLDDKKVELNIKVAFAENNEDEFTYLISLMKNSDYLNKELTEILEKSLVELISYKNKVEQQFETISPSVIHINRLPLIVNSFGREEELLNMKVSFHRKIKNNILIVGNPGVGKTTLVQEFCSKFNKNILCLSIPNVLSGTRYRGEFEEKVTQVLNVADMFSIPIFIDEIHTIVSAGKVEGGVSFSDILKPLICNPNLPVIGATTLEEVSYILKDKALNRRFVKMELKEFKTKYIKENFSSFVNIVVQEKYQIPTMDASKLSSLLIDKKDVIVKKLDEITDSYYPDKLIDYLDYTCALYVTNSGTLDFDSYFSTSILSYSQDYN